MNKAVGVKSCARNSIRLLHDNLCILYHPSLYEPNARTIDGSTQELESQFWCNEITYRIDLVQDPREVRRPALFYQITSKFLHSCHNSEFVKKSYKYTQSPWDMTLNPVVPPRCLRDVCAASYSGVTCWAFTPQNVDCDSRQHIACSLPAGRPAIKWVNIHNTLHKVSSRGTRQALAGNNVHELYFFIDLD
jgi:hypothetical protein